MGSAEPNYSRSLFGSGRPRVIHGGRYEPSQDVHESATLNKTKEEPLKPIMAEDITRNELDAKLELIEARADARMSRFEERIDQAIGEMRRESADLKTEMRGLRADWDGKFGSLKTTVVVTAISSVLAIAAINIGLIQTMFGAFESGKTTAAAVSEATTQLKQTQEQLKAIQERLDEQSKRPAKK